MPACAAWTAVAQRLFSKHPFRGHGAEALAGPGALHGQVPELCRASPLAYPEYHSPCQSVEDLPHLMEVGLSREGHCVDWVRSMDTRSFHEKALDGSIVTQPAGKAMDAKMEPNCAC